MRRLKKNVYLSLCGILLAALSLVRACTRPEGELAVVQSSKFSDEPSGEAGFFDKRSGKTDDSDKPSGKADDKVQSHEEKPEGALSLSEVNERTSEPQSLTASELQNLTTAQPHPIRGVHSYHACFPDSQNVQIVAARRWGVRPVRDRAQAEERKAELVFIGSNPYYVMDPAMRSSIPYLVPRAALLLQDIGRNYLDSLLVKGVPLHRIIVTSVLRSEHDVRELQKRNGNVSPESCHRFATTFDIAYNRYNTVQPPGQRRREVQNDTLKWILCEVLRDLRRDGRCYVKYEVKQGCFHITTR